MHTPQTLHDSSPYGVHCKVTSARLLSKLLRLSQSSILRADKDILTLPDEVRPICMDGRRALIIDEKYPGRDKNRVSVFEFQEVCCRFWGMDSIGQSVNSEAIQTFSENAF